MHSHPYCNGSRKLQSTFVSRDISAGASSFFLPIHNICVEVCWKCNSAVIAWTFLCIMLSILDVESVLNPLGHITIQLQINPMENQSYEIFVREVRKNWEALGLHRSSVSSKKSFVFLWLFIPFRACSSIYHIFYTCLFWKYAVS